MEAAGVHVKQQSEVVVGGVSNQLSRAPRHLKGDKENVVRNGTTLALSVHQLMTILHALVRVNQHILKITKVILR